jgi:hypothetical protein
VLSLDPGIRVALLLRIHRIEVAELMPFFRSDVLAIEKLGAEFEPPDFVRILD